MQSRWRNPYNWYLVMLGALSTLPLLAPLFMKLSESAPVFATPARFIYLLYSLTCHQFASRSIHFFDYQLAWCARDTGIWLALFISAVLVKVFRLKGIRWFWLIPFILPVALDGGVQTVETALKISPVGIAGSALYISSNLVRFVSGCLLGTGVALWISPLLADSFDPAYRKFAEAGLLRAGWKQTRIVLLMLAALMSFYIGMIGLWNATSVRNKPSDWLDSAVKTPLTDFYSRRQNGICPTTGSDLFNADCLLGVE